MKNYKNLNNFQIEELEERLEMAKWTESVSVEVSIDVQYTPPTGPITVNPGVTIKF
jgi:hypothetical protein